MCRNLVFGLTTLWGCGQMPATCALVNSWTNQASGYWEDPAWSLGLPPGAGQSILLTNSGWKALAISAATVQNCPQALSIASLAIASPIDSFNTLLVNQAGLDLPLTTDSLTVASNSAVVLFSSALQVNNQGADHFSVNGTFTETESSAVSARYLSLGENGPGIYNLTNSFLSVGGEFLGGIFTATFNQDGGTNSFDTLHLNHGSYNLYEGHCTGTIVIGDLTAAVFNQWGGSVTSSLAIARGSYALKSGMFSGPGLILPALTEGATGSFMQTGGTNTQIGELFVGAPRGSVAASGGSYGLVEGVLNTADTFISYFGNFDQRGGRHVVQGAFSVVGTVIQRNPGFTVDAYATLGGGVSSCQSLSVEIAVFSQSGGTNLVAGDLTLARTQPGTFYNLSGGNLQTSNTIIFSSYSGAFNQSGGVHRISHLLKLARNADFYQCRYVLSDGELDVADILVNGGAVFRYSGGTLIHSGVLTLDDGVWEAKPRGEKLGPLQLSGSSISTLSLPGSGCVVQFATSSSLGWSNQSRLVIENWNGSSTGAGIQQILFGNDASSLTRQQLSQLQFMNPSGCAPGIYPARILATGEITPGGWLDYSLSSDGLVLQWDTGFILQTATTVCGPYADLTGVTSPYTIQLVEPQMFFRLRHL